MANNRGNKYSSESLGEIEEERFYDYSFAEMGEFDIPAMYSYILDTQGYKKGTKLTTIGYSQGTSQMFSGLLEEGTGEYLHENTEKFLALAPIVYLNHVESWIYKAAVTVFLGQNIYKLTTTLFGSYQSLPTTCRGNYSFANFVSVFCKSSPLADYMCRNFIPGVKINPFYDNILDNFKKLSEYYPSGSSAKSMIHLGQLMMLPKDEFKFQRFDYGPEENVKRYGEEKTPSWDVSKIRTKVVIINGKEDF